MFRHEHYMPPFKGWLNVTYDGEKASLYGIEDSPDELLRIAKRNKHPTFTVDLSDPYLANKYLRKMFRIHGCHPDAATSLLEYIYRDLDSRGMV